jgi:hypothetical protein
MEPTGLYKLGEDGVLHYNFHAGQQRAWRSRARFVCVLSGTQGGKTTFGPSWLHQEIQRRGPGDYLVATPTYPLLYAKALPEFRRLFEKRLQLGRYISSPVKRFEFDPGGLAGHLWATLSAGSHHGGLRARQRSR